MISLLPFEITHLQINYNKISPVQNRTLIQNTRRLRVFEISRLTFVVMFFYTDSFKRAEHEKTYYFLDWDFHDQNARDKIRYF